LGNKRILFETDCVYHAYNHGNADDVIFREDTNYTFFLKRYRKYIPAIADTYAYCLMPNHFHIMMRIKDKKGLVRFFKTKNPQGFQNPEGLNRRNLSNLIANQFGTLFNSYTKSYNSYYNRRGSLFESTFKRNKVEDDTYFTQLVRYIHLNPVKHGFTDGPGNWPHSSYNSYLSNKPTLLQRKRVLQWFDGLNNFIEAHKSPQS